MSDEIPDTTAPETLGAHDEIFIALAGAVGTRLSDVKSELAVALDTCGYASEEVVLSAALPTLPGQIELPEAPYDARVWAYMDAANDLRDGWQRGDALALLAVDEIARRRSAQPVQRRAYILRSVKHPDEVQLLRAVYGPRFILVSAYSPVETRLAAVRQQIEDTSGTAEPTEWDYQPEQLLERDENESIAYGQHLRDVFPMADYFVDARDRERLRPEIQRLVALIFGDPFRTPSREEYGLYCAHAASARSAELGRQVGACLTADNGEVIAIGCNEVPKCGGGPYWEGDEGDAREFHRDRDTSDERKGELAEQVIGSIAESGALSDEAFGNQGALQDLILRGPLAGLTEYGRAVHAEMAALLDAARRGISVEGSTLYSTTFPCHNCARHVIAAGVKEVVYIEPYAKSLASKLHEDAMVVASSEPPGNKVHFRPFVGVAPSLYQRVFEAAQRKTDTGQVREFDPPTATCTLVTSTPTELRLETPYHVQVEERLAVVLEQLLADEAQPEIDQEPEIYDE